MKLLIVEDDRMLSALVRRALIEEGHTVDVAADGEQAEALAFVNDYDAIVLDLMLPGKSGLQVLQELRREGRATPTLILTGRRDKQDVVRGLDLGADDYLTKPFDLDELKARVRALLRRGGHRADDPVMLAGIVLDRRRRQATVGGQMLRMTRKEFALLERLMLNADDVVTRSELLEKSCDRERATRCRIRGLQWRWQDCGAQGRTENENPRGNRHRPDNRSDDRNKPRRLPTGSNHNDRRSRMGA